MEIKKKTIYYWSPALSKVATCKAVINSVYSFKKYSKDFNSYLINACGEWNYYKKEIEEKLKNNNILISAHGNSIRALCKYLFKLDDNKISKLEIPTGNPLLMQFDLNNKILNCNYLDTERAKDLLVY